MLQHLKTTDIFKGYCNLRKENFIRCLALSSVLCFPLETDLLSLLTSLLSVRAKRTYHCWPVLEPITKKNRSSLSGGKHNTTDEASLIHFNSIIKIFYLN